ncbi:FAD binding domain of DNA photolyase-domain-containing protein [Crassisporium funariophilum]|nr:FAD binding domain of DNA photolyase-domain-containing protein [Crassisporium funariophilum]
MAKRSITQLHSGSASPPPKRVRPTRPFAPIKIASALAAAAVDAHTPFSQLEEIRQKVILSPPKGKSVVFWMRMADLRINDNRALSRASEQAQKDGVPLIALFVISPQDYISHDRSARRIDFTLRNLATLKTSFSRLDIPFKIAIQKTRKAIPLFVLSLCEEYGATSLFANIEYEVDELRRDIEICKLATPKGFQVNLFHNKCVLEPGIIVTKQNKPYTVYSPYQRNWLATLNSNITYYLEDYKIPKPNDKDIRSSQAFGPLFSDAVPTSIDGFELDEADKSRMKEVWPEGEDVAAQVLQRFLKTKARPSQLAAVNPLSPGSANCDKYNRIAKYAQDRDRVDRDTTSRLSVYLSSGVISARACVRATMLMLKIDKVEGGGTSGVGRWIQEVAWRDFYTNILAAFPRVSMGRPYQEKFSKIVWENHQAPEESAIHRGGKDDSDGEMLRKWKDGKTGVPIVDAAMRCLKEMGWVHNRARMITAMYLTKDLMIDWRVGERYFMETLIDGDLASNNGGWQWCASTGVDPCPYFRIFNPYSQSLKADPTGDFIRHWVPELRKLAGPDLHNPSAALAKKLGYPLTIIPHAEARNRALRRYKNPGEE